MTSEREDAAGDTHGSKAAESHVSSRLSLKVACGTGEEMGSELGDGEGQRDGFRHAARGLTVVCGGVMPWASLGRNRIGAGWGTLSGSGWAGWGRTRRIGWLASKKQV